MQHLDIQLARRWLRGQLDPGERRTWEEHLNTCAACRALVDSERALVAALELGDVPERSRPAPPAAAYRSPRAERRRDAVLLAFGLAAALGLGGLLARQLAFGPGRALAATQPHQLAPELQDSVIRNLPALRALEREPWLADEFETVRLLAQFALDGARAGARGTGNGARAGARG